MVDRLERLNGSPVLFSAVLPSCAIFVRTLHLLITIFYKKTPQDKQQQLKQWQREKIINLGLGSHAEPPPRSPAKDVDFVSWDRKKITDFGLSKPQVYKKTPKIHQPKQKLTDADLTPKITPVQAWKKEGNPAWKKEGNQISFDKDSAVDDFFKILGYD